MFKKGELQSAHREATLREHPNDHRIEQALANLAD
jgi:hypothetical protein